MVLFRQTFLKSCVGGERDRWSLKTVYSRSPTVATGSTGVFMDYHSAALIRTVLLRCQTTKRRLAAAGTALLFLSIALVRESAVAGAVRVVEAGKAERMEMMNNNMNNNSSSSDKDAVGAGNAPPEVAHSLDDSENSVVLQDELFLDADLYGIFGDDGDGDALVEFDPSIVMEQHQVENSNNKQQASSREQHPDQQHPKRRKVKDGSPSEITRKTGKTKRRSSKLEGENRGLPPPGWHCEAADKQHRQEMILEMYVLSTK